jgi:hypothetical protein
LAIKASCFLARHLVRKPAATFRDDALGGRNLPETGHRFMAPGSAFFDLAHGLQWPEMRV